MPNLQPNHISGGSGQILSFHCYCNFPLDFLQYCSSTVGYYSLYSLKNVLLLTGICCCFILKLFRIFKPILFPIKTLVVLCAAMCRSMTHYWRLFAD